MNNTLSYDLSLIPTTLDQFHIYLAAAVIILSLILIVLLLGMVISLVRRLNKKVGIVEQQAIAEPEVKIVEKTVEVEKIVQAPPPEPVVLKEATPDAALQLLNLLQKEARFIDFINEEINAFSDAEIGAAARVVHEGCSKVIKEHFALEPIRQEQENTKITLPKGFDAASIRLTGNIVGDAPFTGVLVHKGWQITNVRLPKLTAGHNAKIIAPAEVEL
jgi:Domain of unknown function (DUF2760)